MATRNRFIEIFLVLLFLLAGGCASSPGNVDRKIVIHSLNLDSRSFYENSEIGVIVSSPQTAVDMAESFDKTIDKGAFRLELVTGEDADETIHWHGYHEGEPATYDVDPYISFLAADWQ